MLTMLMLTSNEHSIMLKTTANGDLCHFLRFLFLQPLVQIVHLHMWWFNLCNLCWWCFFIQPLAHILHLRSSNLHCVVVVCGGGSCMWRWRWCGIYYIRNMKPDDRHKMSTKTRGATAPIQTTSLQSSLWLHSKSCP